MSKFQRVIDAAKDREDTAVKPAPLVVSTKRRGRDHPVSAAIQTSNKSLPTFVNTPTKASRLRCCKKARDRSSVSSLRAYLPSGSRRVVDTTNTQML